MADSGLLTRMLLILAMFLAEIATGYPQSKEMREYPGVTGANYRIYPGDTDQTEVFIVRSPVDPEILWVSCNTLNFIPFFISEGIYTTLDGGNSWHGNDTCTGSPVGFHGGDPGITITAKGTFLLSRLGRTPFTGLFSHFSTDNGMTWSAQKAISTDDLERAVLATDANQHSTYFGRSYAAYVKFAMPFPVMFAYTANEGQSWSIPTQVNNPTNRSAGGDIAMGPNGELYMCWAGVTDVSPFKEIMVGVAKSTNGGATWQVTENAFSVNGITGVLPNKSNIRVNGLPSIAVDTTQGPRRGWVYIITTQKDLTPAGTDPDIILYRSTDSGISWSPGIRVNQDPVNNKKTQYFPNLHIDRFGAVNVIFYDDRTTTTDSTGVFLARSADGGDTWKEYEISDHHFKPYPIGGLGQGYQGDVIDISSTDTKLMPVWMDNSTGAYQIWHVPVEFSSLGIADAEQTYTRVQCLVRISPNPFSAVTTLIYRVPAPGRVSLVVSDMYGREVVRLTEGYKTKGEYGVVFDPDRLRPAPSSLFFYHFSAGTHTETGKLIRVQ